MGCANEKECNDKISPHGCGIYFSHKSNRQVPKESRCDKDADEWISDAKNYYSHVTITTEFPSNSSSIKQRTSRFKSEQLKDSYSRIENFDQSFLIGQYLNFGDEINESEERRTKSFNPDEKWRKKNEKLQELYKEEYYERKNELKNEFYDEYLRKSYHDSKDKFNKKLRMGPSQELRWFSWKTKLLDEIENKQLFQFKVANLYEYLLCPFMIKNSGQFYDDNMYLIVKDISRTFPELKFFEDLGLQQLKRTLLATSNLLKDVKNFISFFF